MEKELIEEMRKLTKSINKTNNLWWTLLRGALNGFGVVVGAGVLVALFIYILSHIEGWAYIGHYAHDISEAIKQNKK